MKVLKSILSFQLYSSNPLFCQLFTGMDSFANLKLLKFISSLNKGNNDNIDGSMITLKASCLIGLYFLGKSQKVL
jgi:hypothetical protein